jgi:hypothetical protein
MSRGPSDNWEGVCEQHLLWLIHLRSWGFSCLMIIENIFLITIIESLYFEFDLQKVLGVNSGSSTSILVSDIQANPSFMRISNNLELS